MVVKKVVGVPPLLVILALLIGFKLFGFLGVLLSVPIAAAVQELVADIDKRKRAALPPELAPQESWREPLRKVASTYVSKTVLFNDDAAVC